MADQELIQALRTHLEAARKIGLYSGKSGIWAVIEQAADRIANQNTHIAALQKAIEDLRAQLPRWIPVTERLPEERVLVNVVWVNRAPEPYYEKIKNVPFSGTACFYGGRWYWDSPVLLDYLAEYGKDEFDLVDEAVEITHWAPLPEPPEVEL